MRRRLAAAGSGAALDAGRRWTRLAILGRAVLGGAWLALVSLVMALTLATTVGGHDLQVVATGSMEPTIPTGALVVVEPVAPADIGRGDVVVFAEADNPDLVMHRVLAVDRSSGAASLVTKGDANRTADPRPVDEGQVRGRVRWAVPGAADWVAAITGPPARLALVGAPLVWFLASFLPTRPSGTSERRPHWVLRSLRPEERDGKSGLVVFVPKSAARAPSPVPQPQP